MTRSSIVALTIVTMALSSLLLDVVSDRVIEERPWHVALADVRASDAPQKIVLVGTSRFQRVLDPRLLDRELARAGCDATAFIVGDAGLSFHEERLILEALAAMEGDGPSLIVVESFVALVNRRDHPLVNDADLMVEGARALLESRRNSGRDLALDVSRLMKWFVNGSLGRGRLYYLWPSPGGSRPDLFRGYEPIPAEPETLRDEWMSGWSEYQTRLESALDLLPPNGAVVTRLAEVRLAILPAHQATMVVTMPTLHMLEDYLASAPQGALVLDDRSYVNLSDPSIVEEMLDPAFWRDEGHASQYGSEVIARHLAPHLCEALDSGTPYALR